MHETVRPKEHVAPGTRLHSFIGWTGLFLLGPLVALVTILVTYGVALIFWIGAGLFYWSRVAQARARLRGSAVRVGEDQFPDIHAAAVDMSRRIGLPECPDVYVMEDSQQNAFALKQGRRQTVVLIDDVVHGCLAAGGAGALNFVLAHELAHHALGHTGMLRAFIASKYPPLSRLDELSCDAVAHAVVGDPAAARDALALLLIGPQLFPEVNREALARQAREVAADRHAKKSEKSLTHPLLLRRYARLDDLAGPAAGRLTA